MTCIQINSLFYSWYSLLILTTQTTLWLVVPGDPQSIKVNPTTSCRKLLPGQIIKELVLEVCNWSLLWPNIIIHPMFMSVTNSYLLFRKVWTNISPWNMESFLFLLMQGKIHKQENVRKKEGGMNMLIWNFIDDWYLRVNSVSSNFHVIGRLSINYLQYSIVFKHKFSFDMSTSILCLYSSIFVLISLRNFWLDISQYSALTV